MCQTIVYCLPACIHAMRHRILIARIPTSTEFNCFSISLCWNHKFRKKNILWIDVVVFTVTFTWKIALESFMSAVAFAPDNVQDLLYIKPNSVYCFNRDIMRSIYKFSPPPSSSLISFIFSEMRWNTDAITCSLAPSYFVFSHRSENIIHHQKIYSPIFDRWCVCYFLFTLK